MAHTYEAEKARYARFCLVNKQFLPIAREHLYSRLTLVIPDQSTRETFVQDQQDSKKEFWSDTKLAITLLSYPQCGKLVRVLDASFEEIPPTESIGNDLCGVIENLPELRELWLLDMGKGFWSTSTSNPTSPSTSGSTDVIKRLTENLTAIQKNTLKVLVIPQLYLSFADTNVLFTSITSLSIYKGTILAPLPLHSPKSSLCRLQRVYITHFQKPEDVRFVLFSSLDSLRYLHLIVHLGNGTVDLSSLRNLETLVVTGEWISPGPMVGTTSNFMSNIKSVINRCEPDVLLNVIFSIAESARWISSLRVFSLFTNLGNYIAPHFERHFLKLPPSIVDLSIGPTPSASLPWSILFKNLHLYPLLRKLYLTIPASTSPTPSSVPAPAQSPSLAYFGISEEVLEEEKGLKVRWFEDEYAWLSWKENRFYPQASIQEMMGKPNEFAWRQEQQQNCTVS